jgi:UDP-glucose 4-epimerase
MKNILITGGIGYVGGRLTRSLSNFFNIIVSSRKKISKETLDIHGIKESILHKNLLSKKHFPNNIDIIIHLAALNELECVKEPEKATEVNVNQTRLIIENAISFGVINFIYFSTIHVYGNPLKGLINENSSTKPIHQYAVTHKNAEDELLNYVKKNKINGTIIRLSNSFGPPIIPSVNRWTLLVNDLCRQAIENKILKLNSDGSQYIDFISLSDVENVVETIVKKPMNYSNKNIYNLGSGKSLKVIEMAKMIANEYENLYKSKIEIVIPNKKNIRVQNKFIYSVERLLSKNIIIANEFKTEIRNLLIFCKLHFTNFD